MQPELDAALAQIGIRAETARWERLHGGLTNWSWRVIAKDQDCVVKLYDTRRDNPLFPNDPVSEARVLSLLSGTDLAPSLRLHRAGPQADVTIVDHIDGACWSQDTAKVARLLHRLHKQSAPSDLRQAPDGSAAIARQTLAMLDTCPGPVSDALRQVMPTTPVAPSGRACLLHGDPVPGNIIVGPDGRAMLIDWQCPAIGDPCEDIALFLSPAMQQTYRTTPLTPKEEADFLAAYPDRETVERFQMLALWYHWRMAAYCLWAEHHRGREMLQARQLEENSLRAANPLAAETLKSNG